MTEEKLQKFQSRTGEPLPSLEVSEDEYGDPVIYWDESQSSLKTVTEAEDIVSDLAIIAATSPPPSSGRSKRIPSLGQGVIRSKSRAIINNTEEIIAEHQIRQTALFQELNRAGEDNTQKILDQMEENNKQLHLKIQENIDLTTKVAQTAAELDEAQKVIIKMHENHARVLAEALELAKKTDKRVEALATMTFELFEYQVPRLFIVLPDNLDWWTDIWNPVTDRFRLYFLCECGEHTKVPSNSTVSNHIHMALHEGYPIVRPSEFFQQYGPYLMTVMEMVRFGSKIAGSVVPALTTLGITDGIEQLQKSVNFTKEKFTPLLEKSIEFTQSKLASSFGSKEGENVAEEQEALQGADLRQLATFLEGADASKALANLYRTVTDDGHVKWVCLEHFNVNYNERASEKLMEVVEKYHGSADKLKGYIEVSLSGPDAAGEFYGALKRAKYFTTLFVTLEWEVTKDDLEILRESIMLSGITDLRVAGQGLQKKPILDLYNSKSKFDPFISLLTTLKLRSFALDDCPSFLKRVSSFRSTGNSVKSLKLTDSWSSQKSKAGPDSIAKLVECFPQLIDLQLHSVQDDDVHRAFDALEGTLQEHRCIKRVTFDGSVYDIVDRIVSLVEAVYPTDIYKPLWNAQKLRRLTVESFSKDDMLALKTILVKNTSLTDMTIRTTKADLFNHTAQFQKLAQDVFRSIKVTFASEEFIGATIVYNGTPPPGSEKQLDQSGNGFRGTMDVQYWNFDGCGIPAFQPRQDADFEMLDWATKQGLPAPFTALALDVSALSQVGLESLGRVLGQIDLELLSITTTVISSKVDKSEERVTANALINMNWSRLIKLELLGAHVPLWITEMSKIFKAWKKRGPSSQPPQEPRWDTLYIRADTKDQTEVGYVRSQNLVAILQTLPPKQLDLCNLKLHVQDWGAVLGAVDYSVLRSLSLVHSKDYDPIFIEQTVPSHVTRSM
ncbi:hypothetical protein BGZ93_001683 [Podila epicladia]|nr:hypothetical protein BGZ93_001683 [Podila epicladia]